MLHHVAILYHPQRERAVADAQWLASELDRRHISSTTGNAWDSTLVAAVAGASDLIVALGGDGTIIQVARLSAPEGVPVLGINLGRVGFLAELTPEALRGQIDAVAEERFWLETRAMLDVVVRDGDKSETFLALNEVSVARGQSPRAIHVNTCLDGEDFMTYTADGVLVATATGSTAYSLAAGGPILYPESTDFLLTPVAPHLHIGRSMVLPGDTNVSLTVDCERPAVAMIDGAEERPLSDGRTVDVKRSETVARFARLKPSLYFYAAIADRLR